jgi:hypothetical protein
MAMMARKTFAALGIVGLLAGPVLAQDIAPPENIPFDGGTFTITQNEDYEKVLTYDGREIARNYAVFFDKETKVGETSVAILGGRRRQPVRHVYRDRLEEGRRAQGRGGRRGLRGAAGFDRRFAHLFRALPASR